jgi:hypothetical protein
MARLGEIEKTRASRFGSAIALILCVCAALAFAAEPERGMLEVQIKDHRDAIGDFARLDITIDKILVSPAPGLRIWQSRWRELAPSPATIDLTRYVDNNAVTVFRGSIDAGAFDGFHVKLKSIEGTLKKNQRSVPVKDTVGPVKLSFQLAKNGAALLVVDLTVTDLSDHPPRGYELSVKGLELFSNGKRIQKIPPG